MPTAWDHILENGEPPKRNCQALSAWEPLHPAEVIVTGSDGLQWYSCKAHIPKSAFFVEEVRTWFKHHDLTHGV